MSLLFFELLYLYNWLPNIGHLKLKCKFGLWKDLRRRVGLANSTMAKKKYVCLRFWGRHLFSTDLNILSYIDTFRRSTLGKNHINVYFHGNLARGGFHAKKLKI